MADRNGIVQRAPLPPLNSPLINEADRARVFGVIGKALNNILNGPNSYHADTMMKSSRDLMLELDSFANSVKRLKGAVNDPADIVGDAVRHLDHFKQAFKNRGGQ
jgi:hypothetical protein